MNTHYISVPMWHLYPPMYKNVGLLLCSILYSSAKEGFCTYNLQPEVFAMAYFSTYIQRWIFSVDRTCARF